MRPDLPPDPVPALGLPVPAPLSAAAAPAPVRQAGKDRSVELSTAQRSRRWASRIQLAISVTILAIVFGCAIFAPWIAPEDPNMIALDNVTKPPSAEHWMGTDQLGRDVLSRVIWGGRVSLFLTLCAVLLAGSVGTLIGVISGYMGGVVDSIMMRCADVQFSLPSVILAMMLVGAVGASTLNLIIVLSLANWARFARVIRSEALTLRQRDFVLLARLGGASAFRIVAMHIIPNVMNTFIVLATLDVGLIIILEATLSFLGLGVQPPDPSWGSMIADGRGYLEQASWIALCPGAVLMATVLAGNMLGDSLRDRLNPALASRW
jgi:peptide/nickel transport system permease protein